MPVTHTFDPPERFVAGTVGEPGARTFFVQARAGSNLVSVALEKQQVQILAREIDELLDKLIELGDTREVVPAVTPALLADSEPLDTPIEEQFRVGTITLSWDPSDERVALEIFAVPIGDPDADGNEPEPEEMMVVRLPAAMARAFCSRAAVVVNAGREPCQFCGEPLDPQGHLCPRANGFRRTSP